MGLFQCLVYNLVSQRNSPSALAISPRCTSQERLVLYVLYGAAGGDYYVYLHRGAALAWRTLRYSCVSLAGIREE
jgi:hypothetical protein